MNINKKRLGSAGAIVLATYLLTRKKKNRHRQWWVRPINKNLNQQGDYEHLLQEMRLTDSEMSFNYTRVTVDQFDELLKLIRPVITEHSYRKPIFAGAHLTITLRHLAAGDSIPCLAFAYRVGKSTTCTIINETTESIWQVLHKIVLTEPTEDDWKTTRTEFWRIWNVPNCLGLDDKHISIRAPYNSGSLFCNYKKSFSTVLFGVCDAHYCFTHVDIDAYGSQSDGSILLASAFGNKLNNNTSNISIDAPFPGLTEKTPCFLLAIRPFHYNSILCGHSEGKIYCKLKEFIITKYHMPALTLASSYAVE